GEAAAAADVGFESHPQQQQQNRRGCGDGDDPDDDLPRPGGAEPVANRQKGQPEIEPDDHGGGDPGEPLDPRAVDEAAHAGAVAGEVDQRHHGKGQLHADDHLAEQEERQGGAAAHKVNGESGGRDGHGAGDHTAHPRPYAEVEKALHDDLTGKGSGQRGGLAGTEQCDGEHDARQAGAEQRHKEFVGLLDFRDDDAVFEEHGRGQHQDGAIDEHGAVERHQQVDEVVAAGGTLGRFVVPDAAGLHQSRVEVEVMGHYRGPDNADGQVETVAVEARRQAAEDLRYHRLGPEHFDTECRRDHGDERKDEGLDGADTEALEEEQEQGIGPGENDAGEERDVKEHLERDGGAQHFGQVAGGDDAEAGAEGLEQHGHGVGHDQHPEQPVAEARAAFEVGGPVPGVHVADAHQVSRPGKSEHAAPDGDL